MMENKTSNKQETKAMPYDALLTPVILQAINDDAQYQALLQKRVDLHNIAIPKVIKNHNGTYEQRYSDEFYELLSKINQMITHRQQQIIDAYSNGR